MDKLNAKVDKIQEDISEIKVIMAVNTKQLEVHMARTAALEENLDLLKQDFTPVKTHVLLVNYTIALIGALFTAALTLYGIYVAIQSLRS